MNDESTGSGSRWEPDEADQPTETQADTPAVTESDTAATTSGLTARLGRRGALGVAGAGLVLVSGLGGYAIASTADGGSSDGGSRESSSTSTGAEAGSDEGQEKGERPGHRGGPPPGGIDQDSDQMPEGQETDES